MPLLSESPLTPPPSGKNLEISSPGLQLHISLFLSRVLTRPYFAQWPSFLPIPATTLLSARAALPPATVPPEVTFQFHKDKLQVILMFL